MADIATTNAYLAGLSNIAAGLERSIPADLARLATWEAQARAAGVQEANVIAVLRSWNAWEQANADLRDVAIPLEMRRVQNGGEAGTGDLTPYRPTNPPNLPAVSGVLLQQGGARTGADQYSGPISPIDSPAVDIPIAVRPAAPRTEEDGPPGSDSAGSPGDDELVGPGGFGLGEVTKPGDVSTRSTSGAGASSAGKAPAWVWVGVALVVVWSLRPRH